jgi:hypothetical protein
MGDSVGRAPSQSTQMTTIGEVVNLVDGVTGFAATTTDCRGGHTLALDPVQRTGVGDATACRPKRKVAQVHASPYGSRRVQGARCRARAGYGAGCGRTGCLLKMDTRLKALMAIATQMTAEISSSVRTSRADS